MNFKNIFKKSNTRFKKTKWDNLIADNPFSKKSRIQIIYSNNIPKSVSQIIGINIIVFIFLWICEIMLPMSVYEFIVRQFAIPTNMSVFIKPWTIITSGITHISFIHIFFNMYGIFCIAPYFKMAFSDKQIWNIYILGHIFGIICAITMNILLLGGNGLALGASCGVSALVLAVCFKYPKLPIMLLFFNSTMKWVGILFIAQSVYMLFTTNIVGGMGHLFGMLMGILYVFYLTKNVDLGKVFNPLVKK